MTEKLSPEMPAPIQGDQAAGAAGVPGSVDMPKLAAGAGKPSRRAWMAGAAGAATGVVLMRNRPVYGGSCVVPSAFLSAQTAGGINNLSHQPTGVSCGSGRSPGYWKQAYTSNTTNGVASNSLASPQPSNHFNNAYPDDSQTFAGIFGAGPIKSFGYVLKNMPGSTESQYAAGYLNALNSNRSCGANISNYPLTTSQVVALYNGTYKDGSGERWTVSQGETYLIQIAT